MERTPPPGKGEDRAKRLLLGPIGHRSRGASRLIARRWRVGLQPDLDGGRGFQEPRRSLGGGEPSGGRELAAPRFGANLDLDGCAFHERLRIGAKIENGLLGDQDRGTRDPALARPFAPDAMYCAPSFAEASPSRSIRRRSGRPSSETTPRSSPKPRSRYNTAFAHAALQPRPSRRARVSKSGRPTTPVYDPTKLATNAPPRP